MVHTSENFSGPIDLLLLVGRLESIAVHIRERVRSVSLTERNPRQELRHGEIILPFISRVQRDVYLFVFLHPQLFHLIPLWR
jgi:hypothetical protein